MIDAMLILHLRWGSMTPLRQFKGVPSEIIRKAEGKQFVSDQFLVDQSQSLTIMFV